MDSAVGLVQTYLRVNGYFTVVEYPVVELRGGFRTATDLLSFLATLVKARGSMRAAAAAPSRLEREESP